MFGRCDAVLLEVVLALMLCAASPASGQVTILNNGMQINETKVNRLFNTACRVVAEEFHLGGPTALAFPVTLVLGDPNERVIGDELNRTYFIYMGRWDEVQFATSVSRLALQHMVSQERKTRIVAEILRRANAVEPVGYEALRDLKRGRGNALK
jgi:hypothetical protein